MAIKSSMSDSDDSWNGRSPLLDDIVDGAADYKGQLAYRSSSGGWASASFIIGVEMAERFAFYGISSNLINYLTGPLGLSMVTAAQNVNAWMGAASLLPLLGAFVADSWLGRYRTIIASSVLYFLGLGQLTLSAYFTSTCAATVCSPSRLQVTWFFFSLYLVALAQGAHKPCVQAFGADQFDGQDPAECKARSSFFNWWYFCLSGGSSLFLFGLNYVQDNLSWELGFGIPCIVLPIALLIFLAGTTTYRFILKGDDEETPFVRIWMVFSAAARNWRASDDAVTFEEEARGLLPHQGFLQFKFLNKALIPIASNQDAQKAYSLRDVEEAKAILRLIPIWVTTLMYAVVFAQPSTFFTKQGVAMDRTIGPAFEIPAASLQSLITLSIILLIPLYDRVLIPVIRRFTKLPSGLSTLQRIGAGVFVSVVAMCVAALTETRRRAGDMKSIAWLAPQYVLFGVSDVFAMVGLQEFFYGEVPRDMRSVGLAIYLSVFGTGSILSGVLVWAIERMSGGNGWFSDDLNRGHLDYFYWLLAGLSGVGFVGFVLFARGYTYNRDNGC